MALAPAAIASGDVPCALRGAVRQQYAVFEDTNRPLHLWTALWTTGNRSAGRLEFWRGGKFC
jgi:hypothetical protein